MRKSWIALLVMVPCLFAYADENKCKQVSGGILTNFLTESGTVNFPNESGKLFKFATLGTATGDLAGGIGVYIFSFTPAGSTAVASAMHHHWVIYAGDNHKNLADATAKAYQSWFLRWDLCGRKAVATRPLSPEELTTLLIPPAAPDADAGPPPAGRRKGNGTIEFQWRARSESGLSCPSLPGDDLFRATLT